jgi:hypothetical protein
MTSLNTTTLSYKFPKTAIPVCHLQKLDIHSNLFCNSSHTGIIGWVLMKDQLCFLSAFLATVGF